MKNNGFLVLQSGVAFPGVVMSGESSAGEVVFNTSHSGYEEMATDPSYYSQILVTTAPQQGNYGVDDAFWESKKVWIRGFVCLDVQNSKRDSSWIQRLNEFSVPLISQVDTRPLVKYLREQGSQWGAVVKNTDIEKARKEAIHLIEKSKVGPEDWTQLVCAKEFTEEKGIEQKGPRIALVDFGTKTNILRELKSRSSVVGIFPSNTSAEKIKKWNPDGIVLSNGPGDPSKVESGTKMVRELLGWRHMFGICMGHQVLALALGAETYKLRYGHRGSNHPIRDELLNKIYMTSQNHGYNVAPETLPKNVRITHYNLNDNTVAGIISNEQKCMSVQFHPESHPGPNDSVELFNYFIKQLL
jgi:carbamoyl-phosphate synthase small subunit